MKGAVILEDRNYALNVIYDDYYKIAKVNIATGDYHFVKVSDFPDEDYLLQAKTIGEYIRRIGNSGVVHPDDRDSYIYHTDIGYLREKLSQKRRRMVHSYRRIVNGKYIWVTLEILAPKDYSIENPWILISWKEADSEARALEDALNMLSLIFHKILKINLTKDTHEDIKVYTEEMSEEMGCSPKISEWLRRFAEYGFVHEEDKEEYLRFTDIDTLRQTFKKSRDCIRFRYRRKTDNEFRWVMMELLPSLEYTDENQIIMLYIRDIHDNYISELNYQKQLERDCTHDMLTGMYNRYHYDKKCELLGQEKGTPTGLIFADLNGLKYVNDTYGHTRGDEYICHFGKILVGYFGEESCYRISGDEFVVLAENISHDDFEQKAVDLHSRLQKEDIPTASVGMAWSDGSENIKELFNKAEKIMYREKRAFHCQHPDMSRKITQLLKEE